MALDIKTVEQLVEIITREVLVAIRESEQTAAFDDQRILLAYRLGSTSVRLRGLPPDRPGSGPHPVTPYAGPPTV